MRVLIILASLATLIAVADANCRQIQCYIKEGKSGASANSPTLFHFVMRTCGWFLACKEANRRAFNHCNANLNDVNTRRSLCNIHQSRVPAHPNKLNLEVVRMGKADCAENYEFNFWKDQGSTWNLCCVRNAQGTVDQC